MYEYNAEVLRVVDGDTVDVLIDVGFSTFKKERVRLYGINTPECRTRDLEEKKKGLAAKARNKELLTKVSNKPKYFRLVSHGTGKYGRVLGEIHIMDKDETKMSINETLIKEGHAYKYDGGKKMTFKG